MQYLNPNLATTLEGIAPLVALALAVTALGLILAVSPWRRSILTGGLGVVSTFGGVTLCWIAVQSTARPLVAVLVCVGPLVGGLITVLRSVWVIRREEK